MSQSAGRSVRLLVSRAASQCMRGSAAVTAESSQLFPAPTSVTSSLNSPIYRWSCRNRALTTVTGSHVQMETIARHSGDISVRRLFSTNDTKADPSAAAADSNAQQKEEQEQPSEDVTNDAEEETKEESSEEIKLQAQIKNLKDQLLRSLAEQENTRRIAQRDVQSARQFAISSFAKGLLDTSDNLSRAMEAVPEELRNDRENHPQLVNLYEGISMTDANLTKAFEKHGLVKYGARGDPFDPNLHDALYEYPDDALFEEERKEGEEKDEAAKGGDGKKLGQVMKAGFMLNGRVLRPAEVGVAKKST